MCILVNIPEAVEFLSEFLYAVSSTLKFQRENLTCAYTLLLFVKVDDDTVHICKWNVKEVVTPDNDVAVSACRPRAAVT